MYVYVCVGYAWNSNLRSCSGTRAPLICALHKDIDGGRIWESGERHFLAMEDGEDIHPLWILTEYACVWCLAPCHVPVGLCALHMRVGHAEQASEIVRCWFSKEPKEQYKTKSKMNCKVVQVGEYLKGGCTLGRRDGHTTWNIIHIWLTDTHICNWYLSCYSQCLWWTHYCCICSTICVVI